MAQDEDIAEIFDTSLSILFSIPPIAFSTSSPDVLYPYMPPSDSQDRETLRLRLPQPPADLYITLQANNLWLAAIYLADLICLRQIDVGGMRLAELGAGAGLPGIVACRHGATVISSDWAVDEVLDVIRGNFERTCKGRQWAVMGHQWGTDPKPLLEQGSFALLLLADTLWVTAAHSALLDSIFALLEPGGIAHITAGLHTGRGPLERFISSAKSRGAIFRPIREVCWRLGGGWDECFTPSQGLEEERGVVVYFTLQIPYLDE